MKKNNYGKEKIIEKVFFIFSLVALIGIFSITIFILIKGIPGIKEIGIKEFLMGRTWHPTNGEFGILPMIIGSVYVTFGALIIGVPIGVLTAVYIAEIASKNTSNILRSGVELLAGIPSVVYGFFGLVTLVPLIDKYFGGGGNSLLATSIILGIMILPTIVSLSESAIKAVPKEYKEGSYALGSSHIDAIFKVILPSAKSGIFASIVLGLGRAIGETMAVILVSGNTPIIPISVLDRLRTLTANIAIEMGYAYGLHQKALFATGAVLLVFILLLNSILFLFNKKVGEWK